ncbi:hypothetical protein GQP35_004023 [Salmonella enterica subsp. enterica]|nr:hypothetical protein [Salmonella enterica subsp. enterica serovar Wangata]
MKIRLINLKQIQWAIDAACNKRGLEFVVSCFNACIDRGEMDESFRLELKYRRYNELLADLYSIQSAITAEFGRIETEAQEMDEAINTAVRVIKAMAGHDIEAVLAGVRGGLYRNNVSDVYAAGETALRIAVEESHAEALEMNQRCSELYYRYWRWWNVMDEYCRADDLACAHAVALKMNAEHSY